MTSLYVKLDRFGWSLRTLAWSSASFCFALASCLAASSSCASLVRVISVRGDSSGMRASPISSDCWAFASRRDRFSPVYVFENAGRSETWGDSPTFQACA